MEGWLRPYRQHTVKNSSLGQLAARAAKQTRWGRAAIIWGRASGNNVSKGGIAARGRSGWQRQRGPRRCNRRRDAYSRVRGSSPGARETMSASAGAEVFTSVQPAWLPGLSSVSFCRTLWFIISGARVERQLSGSAIVVGNELPGTGTIVVSSAGQGVFRSPDGLRAALSRLELSSLVVGQCRPRNADQLCANGHAAAGFAVWVGLSAASSQRSCTVSSQWGARTSFLSRAPPLEQAIAGQQHSAGKWVSLNSASLSGSGSACKARARKPSPGGPVPTPLGEGQWPGPPEGAQELVSMVRAAILWEKLLPLRGRMGGLVSYAETKRICIGLVHILNQRTQQSGYSGIVGSRQQQQAARFRTWGVPLYSSQGGSMVDGYAQAQQLAEERMLRQLREQASGYFPGVRQRVQSWMQVLWLRQPSRVKGWAPSGRVAGGSSAHTTRWGTVARVPTGGPENSSMWSGQHFSGRSCYPLRGRMGGLVGSSTHSSRCGKGPISIEHTSQVTTALDWNPGWSNSIDADTLRADCTLGNDITRVPLSHRQREHDHQHRLSRSGQTVIGSQAQGLRSGEDGYMPPASCNQQ